MSKTLLVLTIAIAMGGIATTAIPTASALKCLNDSAYVTRTCDYLVTGGPVGDASDTVAFLVEETHDVLQHIADTYGDQLP